jgi:hypothetical protein
MACLYDYNINKRLEERIMGKKKRRGKNYRKNSQFAISKEEMVCLTCAEYIPPGERNCTICMYNPSKAK